MSIKVLLKTQEVETKKNAWDIDDSIPDMDQYYHKNTQIKTAQQLFGNAQNNQTNGLKSIPFVFIFFP